MTMLLFPNVSSFSGMKGHPLSCTIWKYAVCDCETTWSSVARAVSTAMEREYLDTPVCGKVIDHAFEEAMSTLASDTERPPPSLKPIACYFCGEQAHDVVYNGMPACESCKRRASGRRSK